MAQSSVGILRTRVGDTMNMGISWENRRISWENMGTCGSCSN